MHLNLVNMDFRHDSILSRPNLLSRVLILIRF